jgi:hypothetical protein
MGDRFIGLSSYHEFPVEEMKRRAAEFLEDMRRRRTVREFSSKPVPPEVIEACVLAAGTARCDNRIPPLREPLSNDCLHICDEKTSSTWSVDMENWLQQKTGQALAIGRSRITLLPVLRWPWASSSARLRLALILFAACSVACAQHAIKTGPEVGSTFPSFEALDQNGRPQNLKSILGPKGALVVFFRSADW